jgi:hypothetical protein
MAECACSFSSINDVFISTSNLLLLKALFHLIFKKKDLLYNTFGHTVSLDMDRGKEGAMPTLQQVDGTLLKKRDFEDPPVVEVLCLIHQQYLVYLYNHYFILEIFIHAEKLRVI